MKLFEINVATGKIYTEMSEKNNPNGSRVVVLKGIGIETVILKEDLIIKVEKFKQNLETE